MRLLLPFLLVVIAAELLIARRARVGRGMAWSGVLLTAVLSTPAVGHELLALLEPPASDPLCDTFSPHRRQFHTQQYRPRAKLDLLPRGARVDLVSLAPEVSLRERE
jgi:hypothetical protein